MTDPASRRRLFKDLHASGCFVIPNPWDLGSARYLQHLGFKALATSSAGFAFSRGLSDEAVTRDLVLSHLSEIVSATDLPVNADFQAGYASSLKELEESVRLCVETGVSGFSIEDATGKPNRPLFELDEAVDRLSAAREAIDARGSGVLLTGRAECFLVGHHAPLEESVRRLQAYSAAGADVLFAPGLRNREEIRAVVDAVSPKPVNVLISADIGLTVSDLAELGVRRISVGSSLARSAWTGFINAANHIAKEGSFAGLSGLTPFSELNSLFR